MNGETNRETLKRYLLGEFSEAKRRELAEKYFVDDGVFGELLDAENELIDQYVRGQLSLDERKRFAEYLGKLPNGRAKLAAAYALADKSIALEDNSAASIASAPQLRNLASPRSVRSPQFLRIAAAAALLMVAVVVSYLFVNQRRLRIDVQQLQSELAEVQQEKDKQAEEADRERAAAHERMRELEGALAETQTKQLDQNASDLMAKLVLTPALRSSGSRKALVLQQNTRTVSLIMLVPDEERINNYRAVVQSTDGRLVFSQEQLQPASPFARSITLRFPVSRLIGDSFKVTLLGNTKDGVEIARDYYFDVSRK